VDKSDSTLEQKKKEASAMGQALSLAWELGYLIAGPLVILALTGRYLDQRFESSPIFLLIGIVLSVVVTSIGVYWKISRIKL